jgi:PAS domain S-box-containing protein
VEALKHSVLVVDDEPQVLVALQDVLGEEFTVLTADSAETALSLLEKEPSISVIVTDQRMPNMTGDELLARVHDSSPAVSILLTGFADLTAVIRAVNDGRLFAYVTKPWDATDLRAKVMKAAEHFRLGQDLSYERQLLADLMQNATDVVFFKDKDLQFLRVNRAFADLFDLPSPEAFIGKRLADTGLDAASVEAIEAEELAVLERGTPLVDRLRQITVGGADRWFATTKAPIRGLMGEPVGLVAIARDVTARVRAEEALRESERRLREQTRVLNSILDSMAEGVIAVDRAGNFVMFNQQAERMLGPARDLPPVEWAAAYGLFLPDQKTLLPTEQNVLLSAMTGLETVETEIFVKNAHVPGAAVAMTAAPLLDEDDQLTGGMALLRDLTRQRRLEQQLAQAQKMEAIGLLAGGVAHDFNNLLAVIASCGDIVFNDLPEGNSLREDVGEIIEAARRATSLTRQLLAFSRRQVVEPKILDLNAIVSDTQKILRRVIGEDIQLTLDLAPNLGRIRADASQIEQVILNLAVNARDAMQEGGKLVIATANVTLADSTERGQLVRAGDYVRLTVTDSGTGMCIETQRRAFEPFFTTKDVGKGTGLGLSTVYGIATQGGGHVDLQSELGRGTTFHVHLPRQDGTVSAEHTQRPASIMSGATATVLVVEDDPAVRRVAVRILKRQGFRVLEAGHPSEARRVVEAHGAGIDLLLTDVVMPEMSGPRLVQELRQSHPELCVLYMSGYPGGSAARAVALDPAVPLLSKPFTPAELLAKLREILGGGV